MKLEASEIYKFLLIICFGMIIGLTLGIAVQMENNYEEQIKQLEQNNIEQTEEKEVYVNKCKMYEDMLKANGLLDECECN